MELKSPYVVLTGGEPTLLSLGTLVSRLKAVGCTLRRMQRSALIGFMPSIG